MQHLFFFLSLTISLLLGYILGRTSIAVTNPLLIYGILFILFLTLLAGIFKKIEKENKNEIVEDRLLLFYYSGSFLILLITLAFIYLLHPQLVSDVLKIDWLEKVLISIWFAMLGSVAISFKGLADHWQKVNWRSGHWELWYIERPLNGFIIGVVTYVTLQVLNTDAEPSIPTLSIAAFILGLQEKKFYELLKKVSDLVLKTTDTETKNNEPAKKSSD